MSESILKEKSFLFAIRIVMLYKSLKEKQQEYILSKQANPYITKWRKIQLFKAGCPTSAPGVPLTAIQVRLRK